MPSWLELGRELGREPTAGLAHAPACVANISDMGVMMAWSRIVAEEASASVTTLMICNDPWMYRHLATNEGVKSGAAPRMGKVVIKLLVRGYAARIKCALGLCFRAMALRQQKRHAANGGAAILVYGHPTSNTDGNDGYFGNLLKILPGLSRVLHVDRKPGAPAPLEKTAAPSACIPGASSPTPSL